MVFSTLAGTTMLLRPVLSIQTRTGPLSFLPLFSILLFFLCQDGNLDDDLGMALDYGFDFSYDLMEGEDGRHASSPVEFE